MKRAPTHQHGMSIDPWTPPLCPIFIPIKLSSTRGPENCGLAESGWHHFPAVLHHRLLAKFHGDPNHRTPRLRRYGTNRRTPVVVLRGSTIEWQAALSCPEDELKFGVHTFPVGPHRAALRCQLIWLLDVGV